MSRTPPRFLLVDDHALFRVGLSLMLAERWPQALLTQAATWAQALSHLQSQAVDLVLLDIHLPDAHGLSDLHHLRALAPDARVLLMSAQASHPQLLEFAADRSVAFVSKSAQPAHILGVVQALLRGEHLSAGFSAASATAANTTAAGTAVDAVGTVSGPSPPETGSGDAGQASISELHLSILQHLGKGTPNKAIARQLGMSESEVRAEVSWITEWLQATSRREAYERAVAKGLLAP